MSWRSCRQREQPHSAEHDRTVGPPLLSHSLHRAHKKSQTGKHKPLNSRHEPEPGLFLHLCSLRELQQDRGADFLPEQRAQNMVLILKLELRGPKRENEFLQFTRMVLWTKQHCLVSQSGCLPCFCSRADCRVITSGFPWCWERHSHYCASASWLETAKQHLANECCCHGPASAAIRKLLLSSGTSFAGIWVTSLARLWCLFHHWAEK